MEVVMSDRPNMAANLYSPDATAAGTALNKRVSTLQAQAHTSAALEYRSRMASLPVAAYNGDWKEVMRLVARPGTDLEEPHPLVTIAAGDRY